MQASRKLQEIQQPIVRSGLRLLRGSGTGKVTRGTECRTARRDGRIRLVKDSAAQSSEDNDAVRRAHARLLLPSLEKWLSTRLW